MVGAARKSRRYPEETRSKRDLASGIAATLDIERDVPVRGTCEKGYDRIRRRSRTIVDIRADDDDSLGAMARDALRLTVERTLYDVAALCLRVGQGPRALRPGLRP